MCNKRIHSICFTITKYGVHTFKNGNNIIYILQFSYNVYVMFHYEIPWFYKDFKIENLCFLNLHSIHAARILGLSVEIMLSHLK